LTRPGRSGRRGIPSAGPAGEARRRIFHRRAFALLRGSGAPPAELARHAPAAGLGEPAFGHGPAAGQVAPTVFTMRDAIADDESASILLADPDYGVSAAAG
jgi:hypothetical protein